MVIKSLTTREITKFTNTRNGEVKLGERVHVLSDGNLSELAKMKSVGAQFCLFGIPECIGVLGNLGNRGTENAWSSFLPTFLNIQSNRFLSGNEFVVLGEIDVFDLQEEALSLSVNDSSFLSVIRQLCAKVDDLVTPIIREIAEAGMTPIVIGGGHNNAYPILKGMSEGLKIGKGINAINLDAHADFRSTEGRHSGNGFSYAKRDGFLNKYMAFGLHQSYNSEALLKRMDDSEDLGYVFFEDIINLNDSLKEAITNWAGAQLPCGIEVDMDAIKMMPSSAISPSGFSLEDAREFVKSCALALHLAYLHLPEAAPKSDIESRIVGKALSYLVADFAKMVMNKK